MLPFSTLTKEGTAGTTMPFARTIGHVPAGHGHAGRQGRSTGCRTGLPRPDGRLHIEPMAARINLPYAGARQRARHHLTDQAACSDARSPRRGAQRGAPEADRAARRSKNFIAYPLPARLTGCKPRRSRAPAAARDRCSNGDRAALGVRRTQRLGRRLPCGQRHARSFP